jgi:hypothetical protein
LGIEINTLLNKVEAHVRKLFSDRELTEHAYHNFTHTLEVVEVAFNISIVEKLNSDELEILQIASWFHDVGYFNCCDGHEEQSAKIAKEFLRKESFPEDKIEKVVSCILCTKIPQNPKNKMEEIICDADLHHLGLPDAKAKGDILRLEFERSGIKKFTDIEWLKSSISFFCDHKFFTDCAIKKYDYQKNLNKMLIEKKINELEKVEEKSP